jgi:nickel-dependent lactate racemase
LVLLKTKSIQVDYGEGNAEIPVPEDAVVVRCEDPSPLKDPEEDIRQALENPLGMGPISDLVEKGSKATIAFDAPPRSGIPRRLIIPMLLEELASAGVSRENINLICATGVQRKRTREELLDYLGTEIFSQFWPNRLSNHDATRDLVHLGVSELGDYVEYNRCVQESDLVIYSGTVAPLSWGGFTGTGVVVGLGSARSIDSHHSEIIAHPDSCHGDPRTSLYMKHKQAIHAQVERAIGGKILYVDAVVNSKGEVCKVFAGHCPEINEPEWQAAESLFRVSVPQADVLIIGLPLNQLYGPTNNPLLSCMYTTMVARTWIRKPLLRPGGVIIGLVKCDGTVDSRSRPSDKEVIELFGSCFSALDFHDLKEEFLTREDYIYRYRHCHTFHPIHPVWGFYEAQYILDHAGKVIFTGEVNPGAMRKVGGIPARDFDHAWGMAIQIVGNRPYVVVVPDYLSKLKVQYDVQSFTT